MLVVILNDGETYTDIEGCRVVEVGDELDSEDIEEVLKDSYYDGIEVQDLYHVYKVVEGQGEILLKLYTA